MEQALARAPDDHVLRGRLAHVLWNTNERDAALAELQIALRHEPGFYWAWSALSAWSAELGRPDVALGLARELTTRGGEQR